MSNSKLPPDDATLAAHELTQQIKDGRRLAGRREEAEAEPFVDAGEREAMDALASVATSRPAEPLEDGKIERISHARAKPTAEDLPETPDDAYRLMDAVFKKWATNFVKNPREANRELARDLGRDTALYIRAGVLRLTDSLDAINKLSAIKAATGDEGGGEDVQAGIEELRAAMRGGR